MKKLVCTFLESITNHGFYLIFLSIVLVLKLNSAELLSKTITGNSVNAFSSDLNSICRNEVQTNRFEDVKSVAVSKLVVTEREFVEGRLDNFALITGILFSHMFATLAFHY